MKKNLHASASINFIQYMSDAIIKYTKIKLIVTKNFSFLSIKINLTKNDANELKWMCMNINDCIKTYMNIYERKWT